MTDWSPPSTFPSLQGRPFLSIDLETSDPHLKERGSGWPRRDGFICGISITVPDFTGYFPIAHGGGGNMDRDKVLAWLKSEASQFEGTVHGANLLYDLGWLLSEADIEFPRAKFNDCQWVEAILDEDRPSYSLQALSEYHGLGGKDTGAMHEALTRHGFMDDKGKPDPGQMWKLPAHEVGPYAERDTLLPVELWSKQRPMIEEQNLWRIMDLEHRLLPLLLRMRRRGVRVDLDRAAALQAQLQAKETAAMDQLVGLVPAGLDIDVWSNDTIAPLFDHLGVKYPRTQLGAPSFTKDWLAANSAAIPACGAILMARRYQRARVKFVENDVLGAGSTGRVHSELHPLRADRDDDGRRAGAVSGRFASSNPNLQQVSARDEELAPLIRGLYLPDEGGLWCSADYKQQEPKVMLHYAYLMKLQGAAEAVAKFREDPTTDYHQLVADITGLPRKRAKEVNLGIPYGMGGAKLCEVYLGLPTKMWYPNGPNKPGVKVAGDEGRQILNQYHRRLPYVKKLIADTTRVANERGYLTTLGGRRCRFQLWHDSRNFSSKPYPLEVAEEMYPDAELRRAFTHKALNRIIQGTSADMIKTSLLALAEAGLEPQLTVHDENCMTVSSEAEARRAGEVMRDCFPLELPLTSDIAVGPSWGEAVELA